MQEKEDSAFKLFDPGAQVPLDESQEHDPRGLESELDETMTKYRMTFDEMCKSYL